MTSIGVRVKMRGVSDQNPYPSVAMQIPINILFLPLAALVFMTPAERALGTDDVAGKLVVFNDNGAWCWYQDPRIVVDPANNRLLIASVASAEGADGPARKGDVDLVSYDLSSGARTLFVLHHHLLPVDDHDTAALLIRPDGRYLAIYSRHNQDNFSLWRVSRRPHDASEWGPERTWDWSKYLATVDAADHVTYSNLFFLSAEKRVYNFVRAINHDPSIMISSDQGDTWSYGGKLLTEPKLGYVNGYVKYASNGVDRIDFLTTEHHPRDFNNSIYHGYVQGGKLHRSDGTVVHDNILDGHGRSQTELTKVFAAGSVFHGDRMTHAWTIGVQLDSAGRPWGLISARANDLPENTNFSDHRFFYVRLDGTQWKVYPVAKAGACLWPAEQDYTGLAALNPSDPNEVYISTTIDPRGQRALKFHEIFKGLTTDGGQTWTWTPITQNSTVENLRPLVAASGGHTAVLWFRGTMSRSQHYNSAIVGIINQGRP
ncbi:MAG: BNR-4 repeat-containing protein [Thermoguttaceae bacterium]